MSNNKLVMALRCIALLAFVLTSVTQPARAEETPDTLVKKVVEEVMATARSDKDIQAGDIQKINGLVEAKIMPHVNFGKMTASAVGRFWREATAEQQRRITEEFRTLLVYTYSGALSEVRDQKIQYKPLRMEATDTQVEVRTQVVSPRGGEPIQLNYRLEKTAGTWKIIDVNVLGVWLVQNYRTSFAAEIGKGGIDGLLQTLSARNKTLAEAAAKSRA